MFRRESDPPADASGGGGKPASRAGSGERNGGEETMPSQQVKVMQGTEMGRFGADLEAPGSSTHSIAVMASHETGNLLLSSSSSSSGEHRSNSKKCTSVGGSGGSPATSVPPSQDSRSYNSGTDLDYDTTSLGSTPRRTDNEMGSRTSFSSASPFNSAEVGICVEGESNRGSGSGSTKTSVNTTSTSTSKRPESGTVRRRRPAGPSSSAAANSGSDFSQVTSVPSAPSRSSKPFISNGHGSDARPVLGLSSGPGGVPFGASALRKTMSFDGRQRPRGLRPRSSNGSTLLRISSNPGLPSRSTNRSNSIGKQGESIVNGEAEGSGAQDMERLAAEIAAPGVPFDVVVRSAVKIESVMRVLIARCYVRRKLVSEVTAFSLIMERGIEVIKHAFSGKAKPKVVTVNFVSKKGAMQLSWGSKSGVPLETIYGVTKGIKTEALRRVVEPERAENCFSLLTHDRTIDFEVDNPWLVLLVVRALRLFLGAHYDTLPAPTFFSHLCLRSRGVNRPETPKQTLVWTSSVEKPPAVVGKVPESSPVGRTSGSSISGDSVATSFSDGVGGKSTFDNDGDGECEPEPEPEHNVPHDNVQDSLDGESSGEHRDAFGGADEEGGGREVVTSPGGIMALFCSSGRSSTDDFNGSFGGGSLENGSIEEAVAGPREKLEYGEQAEEGPPTVSQLLAAKGMRKRMTLSKRLSATNAPTGPLKGKRFELMALPMDHSGQQERRERGFTEDQEFMPKRTQGMSISIGAGYELPEEQKKPAGAGSGRGAGRSAVEEDLNHKLQSLRKLQLPQPRLGGFRAGRPARTMAFKHMAFFQGAGGSTVAGSGMGSIADMWGDGVRRIHQTDTVRQENQSLEDVRRRDDARTAILVTRSGVHKVPRKGSATDIF